MHFLKSPLALTFWIVLQAVQDQLPDLPRRAADKWTHEQREEGRNEGRCAISVCICLFV